ncbi:MAG TPA: hypothetical protein VLS85_10725, partial [Hanamia sp.]|nr:hypothetical protein [Hanamia sp.]
MLFVKHNKLKCQNLVSFVSAGIIILFIGTSSLSNAQTPIPEIGGTVNHHLSGTLQTDLDNIKKVEKDINDKKNAITSLENKPVESDPQFVADVAAYNKAKKSSDDFFTSNNNKYPTNSPEFSTASAQQKSLDAAANDARAKATLAYTEADSAKKAQIKNLAKELAGLQAKEMRSLNELNGI